MNNDLISRSELKNEIERIKRNVEEWVNHTELDTTKALVKISLFEEFIDLIDNAPTVEPETYIEKAEKDKRIYKQGFEDGKKSVQNLTVFKVNFTESDKAKLIELLQREQPKGETWGVVLDEGAMKTPSCLTNPERRDELLERYKEGGEP